MTPTVESGSHPATDAVLRVGSDPSSEGWRLSDQSYTIGRDDASPIRLADPRVSRRHARLYRHAGGWRISDLGSANGTWVNGQRVEVTAVSPGDRIQVGATELVLTMPDARQAERAVPRDEPTAATNRGGPGTTFHIGNQAGDIDNIGRDQNIYLGSSDAASLEELRKAGPALKALFAVAILLCVAGLVVFIGGMFFMDTSLPDPRNPGFIDDVLEGPETPLNVIVGFGLFLTGFVLAAIASLILALKRRKE